MVIEVPDISSLSKVTTHLISLMNEYKIFLLSGDLGAGKTTLVKQWMQDCGIKEPVSSPTFSIINEYRGSNKTVFHMDMYRLKEIDEAYNIGFEEYLDNTTATKIIEWPGLILDLINDDYVNVKISVKDEIRIFSCEMITQ